MSTGRRTVGEWLGLFEIDLAHRQLSTSTKSLYASSARMATEMMGMPAQGLAAWDVLGKDGFARVREVVRELDAIDALPQVEILTVAAGSSPRLLNACIGTGARGIILALPGNSSLPQSWEAALAAARAAGCSVLVASRTGADPLALTPLKARVRLITTLLDEE